MEKNLYRSRTDRMVAGVCGGLAEYFDLDPTIVRVAVVLIALLTQGGVFLAYLIMAIVVPEEPLPTDAVPADPAPVTPTTVTQPSQAPMSATTAEGIVMPENETPVTPETNATPGSVPPSPATEPTPAAAPAWTAPPTASGEHHGPRGIGWGVILIVLGVVLLAQQFTDIDVWRFWPVIVIALGVSAIIKGVRR